MSANFDQGFNAALTQLQGQVRQLTTRNEESIAQIERDRIAAGVTLDAEKDAHAATRAKLANVRLELEAALARIQRGIESHGKDWDVPPAIRQSWIDWFESKHYQMEYMSRAYRMSCVENNTNCGSKKSPHSLRYVERDQVRHERGLNLDPEENFEMDKHFPFDRLIREAPDVARKIAVMTMKKGSIVHFIARLDVTEPYPPQEEALCAVAHVPMRFWWGPGKDVHINSAPRIKDALAPLYVCRNFAEIFGTAFWTQNKFSFASFGELHIFRRNMRRSYFERIVNIELWWQGSRGALPADWNPETGDHFDHRTWPLSALTWMKRLKSIEIYVDESSKMAKRRSREPQFVQDPLQEATRGQDNNRQLRDLRKLQGLDYVYQLRGIRRIRVYDTMAEKKREDVRDQTFVRDMRAQVSMHKSRRRAADTRVENLKPILRRHPDEPRYVKSAQVDWVVRSLFDKFLKWDPRVLENEEPNGAGDGEGGERSGDGGAGDGGHQDGDSDSDSESSSGSDHDSLFVRQPNSNSVVAQPNGFQGRRAMGSGANDAPTNNGFGNAQGSASYSLGSQSRGTLIGPYVVNSDDDDDDDDDDLILDEARSGPGFWGTQIDLTVTPDYPADESDVERSSTQVESAQIKEEENKDNDIEEAPAPNPRQDALASDADADKPDDAPAPDAQSGNVVGDSAQRPAPRPDKEANVPDICDVTPELEDRATPPAAVNFAAPFASASTAPEMPQNGQAQAQEDLILQAEMGAPQHPPAIPHLPAQNAVSRATIVVPQPEAIVIDDEDDDDDVQFVSSTFAGFPVGGDPIKVDDDDDVPDVPDVREVVSGICRGSNNSRATSGGSTQSNVNVEESASTSLNAIQGAPDTMEEVANMRRSLTPANRQVTPDAFGTPSSSRAAAEDEAFNNLNFSTFGSPPPGADTPLAGISRGGSPSSSDDNVSVRSNASSHKRSRDEDSSISTAVDIDQLAPKLRRLPISSNGFSASVTRGIDDFNLMGGQQDGTRNSPPPKRRRANPDCKADKEAAIAKAQDA